MTTSRSLLQMLVAGLLFFLFAPTGLFAHDYWLEPAKTHLSLGETLSIRLMFGENFAAGTAKPLQTARTTQFRLYGQTRKFSSLLPQQKESAQPAALVEMNKAGTMLVTMERSPAAIEFGRAKFLEYAAQEGTIIGEREMPLSQKRVHETYTRYLKTMAQVGASPTKTAIRKIGQKYEILPKSNPYTPGLTEMKFQVLFDGKPTAEMKVTALQRLRGKLTRVSAKTDARGNVRLPITQTGTWLIRSVKIVPDPIAEGQPVSFHSYWASLTFGYE